MSYANARGALKQYGQASVQADASTAGPHRVIEMLLEGALEKVATAKGHMKRGEVAEKGRHVGWAISIIGGLRMSLDKETGGEIATNLDDLYDYMSRRLLEANSVNDPALLDEVTNLLREIKGAWSAIPESAKLAHAAVKTKQGAQADR
jgi:flagellar protein FliS